MKVLSKKKKKEQKKKKKQAQGRKKGYHSFKKINKFLCESDWYWRKEIAVKLKLPYKMLKTRFPFLYACTSLDTKT